ncbi:MAG: hypothetical protein R2706_14920 [Acidimicrobiales bacterium]
MPSTTRMPKRGNAHGGGRSYGYRQAQQGQIEVVPEEADVLQGPPPRCWVGSPFASIVVDFNRRGILRRTARSGGQARWA